MTPANTKEVAVYSVSCQFCHQYIDISNRNKHETYCKENPNKLLKKRKTPLNALDYENLSKNIKQCKWCKQHFHPNGLPKHEAYCNMNPNGKSGYRNKRRFVCPYCRDEFPSLKQKQLHVSRCKENPNRQENKLFEFDNFEKLRIVKRDFPDLYKMLTDKQIRDYLDNDSEE